MLPGQMGSSTCDSGNMWFVRHMFLEEMDMGKGYAGR